MPLFYQHNINAGTRIAIWRIEEPEEFFLQRVPVKRDVSHPYKRLQHLAGRYLLPALFQDFPLEEILIADTRKPFLENEKYHFSISHCGNFAAAIVSNENRVGVDIEYVTPRIKTIAHKFLDKEEKKYLANWEQIPNVYLELITVLWSAKEAIYKWYGEGRIDFKQHMHLNGEILFRPNEWMEIPFLFLKEEPVKLTVHAKQFENIVLARILS